MAEPPPTCKPQTTLHLRDDDDDQDYIVGAMQDLTLQQQDSWLLDETPPSEQLSKDELEEFIPLLSRELKAQFSSVGEPQRIVFFGEVGVGKSAAVGKLASRLAGYEIPIHTDFPVAGCCTPFTYEYRVLQSAAEVSIRVRPERDEQIKNFIGSINFLVKNRRKSDSNKSAQDMEIRRALSNLYVSFKQLDLNTTSFAWEQLRDEDFEEFTSWMLSRSCASRELVYRADCGRSHAEWINYMIPRFDNQVEEAQALPFPRKIIITIPRSALIGFDCVLVDTVGLKTREPKSTSSKSPSPSESLADHISMLERAAKGHGIILLCNRFSTQLSASLVELSRLLKTGSSSIANRMVLMALPRHGEDKRIAGTGFGYLTQEAAWEQILTICSTNIQQIVSGPTVLPCLAFDSLANDGTVDRVINQLHNYTKCLKVQFTKRTFTRIHMMKDEAFEKYKTAYWGDFVSGFAAQLDANSFQRQVRLGVHQEINKYYAQTVKACVVRKGVWRNLRISDVILVCMNRYLEELVENYVTLSKIPRKCKEDPLGRVREVLVERFIDTLSFRNPSFTWESLSKNQTLWERCALDSGNGVRNRIATRVSDAIGTAEDFQQMKERLQ